MRCCTANPRSGERLTFDPWRRWRFSVGTGVIAPVLGIPIEADSKSKVRLSESPLCALAVFLLADCYVVIAIAGSPVTANGMDRLLSQLG